MSTSLDPFMKLIKNIEDLENEWRTEPNIDYTLRLPVQLFLSNYNIILIYNIPNY